MRLWFAMGLVGALFSFGGAGAQAAAEWTDALIVEVPTRHAEARPQVPVVFPITVENQAVGPTRLSFEVAVAHPRLTVVEPVPITVGAAGTRHVSTVGVVGGALVAAALMHRRGR